MSVSPTASLAQRSPASRSRAKDRMSVASVAVGEQSVVGRGAECGEIRALDHREIADRAGEDLGLAERLNGRLQDLAGAPLGVWTAPATGTAAWAP